MKIISKYKNTILKFITFFVCLFLLLNSLYNDNIINSNAGYYLFDALFNGNILEAFNSMAFSYGPLLYIFYAIWSIPVWICINLINLPIGMESVGVLIWYKLLVTIFGLYSVKIVGLIISAFVTDRNKKYSDCFLELGSSLLFVLPVFAICQCDIIGLCFVLLGILSLIQDKYVKFVFYFAIAIQMKYLALIVFIPLVLYACKKWLILLYSLLGGVSLTVLCLIILRFSDQHRLVAQDAGYYVNKHFLSFASDTLITSDKGDVGIFGLAYALICLWCLFSEKKENNKEMYIWIAFISYCCFTMFYPINYYWIVLIAPFFVVLGIISGYSIELKICELLTSICVTLVFCAQQSWVVFSGNMYKFLMMKNFTSEKDGNSIQWIFGKIVPYQLDDFVPLIKGIGFAAVIVFAYVSYPLKGKNNIIKYPDNYNDIIIITKVLVLVLLVGISILYALR